MSSRRIEDLHPILRPLAVQFAADCKAAGIDVIFTATYRSSAEQDDLYAQGRTTPGRKVTNAKGGQSQHNTQINGTPAARAFDIAIKGPGGTLIWDAHDPKWQKAGLTGKALGLVWGGDWK